MLPAWWLDDYFGKHRYGIRFEGEVKVYTEDECKPPKGHDND